MEEARRGAQGRGGGGAAGRWAVARRAGWSRSRSEAGGRERTEVARAGLGAGSALRVPRVSERACARGRGVGHRGRGPLGSPRGRPAGTAGGWGICGPGPG